MSATEAVFDLADRLKASHALVESPYIDYDYRSEFSQHFSRRFRPPPDRNERILFLRGLDKLVGYCVVRPTAKPVGRAVMGVPDDLARYVSCTAKHTAIAYGRRFEVNGYPFMSQDGEYGRCAHVAIWSIARLQHSEHDTGRHSVAAIVEATGFGQLPDRTVMSGGLTVAEVRETFRRLGLPVLSYSPKRKLIGTSFTDVVCRYLDSGFSRWANGAPRSGRCQAESTFPPQEGLPIWPIPGPPERSKDAPMRSSQPS